jgi:uncharacterized protein (DUF4415 family)
MKKKYDGTWEEDNIAELGDSFFAAAKPIGRPVSEHPKTHINIRLDAEVAAAFRATGRGWQTRINAILLRALKEGWV